VSDPELGSIRLHSSWTGIVFAYAGAALLGLLVLALIVTNGLTVGIGVLAVAAVMLVAVVLADVPISAEFTPEGVVRRPLVRREFLAWDDVNRLERLRVGVLLPRRFRRGGGLVARVGRRRYILVDRMEGPIEFDHLRRVIGGDLADALGLGGDLRPPDEQTPTWLYRREVWRPDHAARR
jgi:hypothetical protein